MSPSKKVSQVLVGRRVRLVVCNNSNVSISMGTEGVVESVHEGIAVVKWSDGTTTGLDWNEGDRWMIVI